MISENVGSITKIGEKSDSEHCVPLNEGEDDDDLDALQVATREQRDLVAKV